MKWSEEAEQAVTKVPFFVRRRVRKRVEEEARRSSASVVTIDHVRSCQRRFLNNMESEVRGYQLERCFGPSGCPNPACAAAEISERLEALLSRHELLDFLKTRVQGPLKMHHEFRVSVSDCPNACSRPQIVDLGLIGARSPRVSSQECSGCGACVDACREGALTLGSRGNEPEIDFAACLFCGQCINACPTGTLEEGTTGYRILVGGKLGRHPQLARELHGIHSPDDAMEIVDRCVRHYKEANESGERFGEVLNRTGIDFLDEEQRKNRRKCRSVDISQGALAKND